MKHTVGIPMMLLSALFLVFAGIQEADAKRMGGGRSFGGKPGYSAPYKRSVTPRKLTPGQQMAQQKNTQRRADFSRRGGLMGMLGGLAIGGLLGALLFGGAFENINFFDILIFGLIAFVLYKIFVSRRRRLAAQAAGGGGYTSSGGGTVDDRPYTRGESDAAYDTPPTPPGVQGGAKSGRIPGVDEAMQRDYSANASGAGGLSPEAVRQAMRDDLPKEFDKQEFMQGAERAFYMMQDAWDKGDLDAIRGLTTDAVFSEIQSQFKDRRGMNRTHIVSLGSDLLEVERVGPNLEAAVLFDAHLREFDDQSNASGQEQHILEVWHFKRSVDATTPTWFLDGIQQVEQ